MALAVRELEDPASLSAKIQLIPDTAWVVIRDKHQVVVTPERDEFVDHREDHGASQCRIKRPDIEQQVAPRCQSHALAPRPLEPTYGGRVLSHPNRADSHHATAKALLMIGALLNTV